MDSDKSIPTLDRQGLRRFGLVMAAMISALFGLLLPWLFGAELPRWPWAVAGLLVLWALAWPASLDFLYHGWMRLGLVLGWFSSRLVLGTLFYLVFTPVSWVLRLRGIDLLQRQLDKDAGTYRKASKSRDIDHMEKPF